MAASRGASPGAEGGCGRLLARTPPQLSKLVSIRDAHAYPKLAASMAIRVTLSRPLLPLPSPCERGRRKGVRGVPETAAG